MAMRRGFLVSLMLNTVWTAFWIPHLIYRQYWYPAWFDFVFWALTVIIPGLISGLTLKTYFYSRLTWSTAFMIIVGLWFGVLVGSLPVAVIISFVFARYGLNLAFGALRGTILMVLTAIACAVLFVSQFLVVFNFSWTYTAAIPNVVQASIGLGALNAVTFHLLVMVARWLGRPKPSIPDTTEIVENHEPALG